MYPSKTKSLHAAVFVALGALGVAVPAKAVHINPDGLGQVLIYPYYTVRNGNVTALSIVNTTSLTKAVKVRFLEGRNSREVLDFNLFLAPTDVWTGVILPTSDGAKLESGDNSCVTPSDLFGNAAGDVRLDGILPLPINAFKNYQYTGANVDNPSLGSIDRTREGYIEVIEMGIVVDTAFAALIKHNVAGVPANCAALDAYEGTSTAPLPVVKLPGFYLASPGGGLTGRASIINSASGTNYTYDITALDGWWAPLAPGPGNVPYSAPGVTTPSISLQAGISTVSYVAVTGNPAIPNSTGVVRAVWASPREAVSAVFMRDSIINEFVTDAGSVSKTDWVVTMPTKRDNIGVGSGGANRPFTNSFASTTATGACDVYTLLILNREVGGIVVFPGPILPLRPPALPPPTLVLCWAVSVLEFGTTGLLGSINNFRLQGAADAFATTGATTTGAAFATFSRRGLQGPNGWAAISFGATTSTTAGQTQQSLTPLSATLNGVAIPGTHFGLPLIGAMFHNYTNTGVLSSYGSVIPHKYTRNIHLGQP